MEKGPRSKGILVILLGNGGNGAHGSGIGIFPAHLDRCGPKGQENADGFTLQESSHSLKVGKSPEGTPGS